MTAGPDIPGWEQFQQRLRGYIARRVPGEAVDDIIGDVILRLLEHKDQVEAARNPLAWIYRVSANRIADYYRARGREPATTSLNAAVDAPGAETAGENTSEPLTELAECVTPLIRQLPTPYRQALMMTEIEGIRQVAAAGRLGLSPSGMKSRVQRGRALLKKSILKCCHVSMNSKGNIMDYERKPNCCQQTRGQTILQQDVIADSPLIPPGRNPGCT